MWTRYLEMSIQMWTYPGDSYKLILALSVIIFMSGFLFICSSLLAQYCRGPCLTCRWGGWCMHWLEVTVCFICSPVAITPSDSTSSELWNLDCEHWVTSGSLDKNSHDPMLLHDIIQLCLLFSLSRLREVTRCVFRFFVLLTFKVLGWFLNSNLSEYRSFTVQLPKSVREDLSRWKTWTLSSSERRSQCSLDFFAPGFVPQAVLSC